MVEGSAQRASAEAAALVLQHASAARRTKLKREDRYDAYLELLISAGIVKPSAARCAKNTLQHLIATLEQQETEQTKHVALKTIKPLLLELKRAFQTSIAEAQHERASRWRRYANNVAAAGAMTQALANAGATRAAKMSSNTEAQVENLISVNQMLQAEVERLRRELIRERERADVIDEQLADRERQLSRLRAQPIRNNSPSILNSGRGKNGERGPPSCLQRSSSSVGGRGPGSNPTVLASSPRRGIQVRDAKGLGVDVSSSRSPAHSPAQSSAMTSEARSQALRACAESGMGTGCGTPLTVESAPASATYVPLSFLTNLQEQLRDVVLRSDAHAGLSRATAPLCDGDSAVSPSEVTEFRSCCKGSASAVLASAWADFR